MSWMLGANQSALSSRRTCEDHAVVWRLGDCALALLADGAGSTHLGGLGAKIAVESGQAFLTKAVPHLPVFDKDMTELLFMALFTETRQALLRQAKETQRPLNDFATTFMGALVTPQAYASFQIGDGFLVYVDAQGFQRCPSHQSSEYANETSFLTDSILDPSFCFRQGPTSFFALSSDGLQTVAIDQSTGTPHPGFFEPFQTYMHRASSEDDIEREILTFLRSSPLAARVKDDCSLALGAWREA